MPSARQQNCQRDQVEPIYQIVQRLTSTATASRSLNIKERMKWQELNRRNWRNIAMKSSLT